MTVRTGLVVRPGLSWSARSSGWSARRSGWLARRSGWSALFRSVLVSSVVLAWSALARRAPVAWVVLAAGCFDTTPPEKPDQSGAGGESAPCDGVCCETGYLAPQVLARPPAALPENSGLAVGRRSGLVFAHNDSGNPARLIVLSRQGEHLATAAVEGAGNLDWEDLAAATSPQGDFLYVADTGDNDLARSNVRIIEVPEPSFTTESEPNEIEPLELRVTASNTYGLVFPDGPRNVETLLLSPEAREAVLVTKTTPAEIYLAPLVPGADQRLELRGTIEDLGFLPSGGDVTWDGRAIGLRGDGQAALFERRDDQSIAEALLGPSCPLPVAQESQGEALAFDETGGYFTLSENREPLHYFAPER